MCTAHVDADGKRATRAVWRQWRLERTMQTPSVPHIPTAATSHWPAAVLGHSLAVYCTAARLLYEVLLLWVKHMCGAAPVASTRGTDDARQTQQQGTCQADARQACGNASSDVRRTVQVLSSPHYAI